MTGKDCISPTARTVLYVYAYVALEWLFFVTKPSFMGAWPVAARLNALLVGVGPFLVTALALHLLLCLAALAASRIPRLSSAAASLPRVMPALIGTAIVLMLVDNFTYTMFHWGIVDSTVYTAPLYWVLCMLVFVLQLRKVPVQSRFTVPAAGMLLLISGAATLWLVIAAPRFEPQNGYVTAWKGRPLPNIIMFASDGITADHMSAYGYERKTTPNLDAYLDRALVADNAFTNAAMTTGSLSSMMTGKYPTTTKLLLPPYTLEGKDAYQSLPRILRKLGYTSLQETVRYYADGPDLNWKESFDFANGRAVHPAPVNRVSFALQRPLHFSNQIHERLADRVEQLLFVKQMVNNYVAVTRATHLKGGSDDERMTRVLDFIRDAQGPFFIHVHLLGSHCCGFRLRRRDRRFSAQPTGETYKAAEFDDVILRSDAAFGQMMALLKERGLLDNTIIVYTSDHDKGWDFRSPVPLIFLFPGGEPRGHIAGTAQLLDVAPTLLDYLKVQVPDWMEGQSLLRGTLPEDRPVFSIYHLSREHIEDGAGDVVAKAVHMGPPTYGLQMLGMVVCHRWYLLQIDSHELTSGAVGDFSNKLRAIPGAPLPPSDCTVQDLPSDEVARQMMMEHLEQRGFTL